MTKRLTQLGFFLALALILAYVESLIPFSFGIPGIRLGLPNLAVILLLYGSRGGTQGGGGSAARGPGIGGAGDAFLINILRIVISGFLFSNLYTILYALAGAVLSFAAMLAGRRLRCFSVVGVSVLGGVSHNIGQLVMAMLVTRTVYVGYYAPYLIAAGTVTGAVLGLGAVELMPYLWRIKDRS